jgi:hypothetical protein
LNISQIKTSTSIAFWDHESPFEIRTSDPKWFRVS